MTKLGPVRPLLPALLPALLIGAFGLGWGTFHGAAAWPGAAWAQGLALLAALGGLAAAADPLRLGGSGRWLPVALLLAVAGSLAVSPVPRAGLVGLALLPAYLLLPAAVARALEGERARRLATAALAGAVAAVALVALVTWARSPGSRAALPLGHHNLLGAFLVVTLPPALVALRHPGLPRLLGALAGAAGGAALVATRSLSAGVAAAVVALLVAPRLGRARQFVAGLALLGLGVAVPRLAGIVSGRDVSGLARLGYAEAALAGTWQRPALGWGPGSTPWRLAEFVRPRPGVHPPGELVGEAHSLPVQLPFELGITGAALALAVVARFGWSRWRERGAARDRTLLECGLLGLAGGAIAAGGDAWLTVPALPVALAIAAGAALAGGSPASASAPRQGVVARWAALALLVAGAVALVRPALAHRHWERARAAPNRRAAAVELAAAARLDPAFPLYAARWSWIAEAPAAERSRAALDAARRAGAVAPLWLRAGSIAYEAGDVAAARDAFHRALALDPLSGAAPFLEFVASAGTDFDCGARALLAEPRLAAAIYWRAYPFAREVAVERVETWPGVNAGWRGEFAEQARGAEPELDRSDEVDLAIEIDAQPALAAALHLFRRSPLPGDVARVRLDRAAVRRMRIGSAAEMTLSAAAAFPHDRCAPADLMRKPLPELPGVPLFRDGFETGDGRRWRAGDESLLPPPPETSAPAGPET